MKVLIGKRAENAIRKTALYVDSLNTEGSGERWAGKVLSKINSLALPRIKYAPCKHPSLSKFGYSCYVFKEWIIAFKLSDDTLKVCRFIHSSRLH